MADYIDGSDDEFPRLTQQGTACWRSTRYLVMQDLNNFVVYKRSREATLRIPAVMAVT